MANAAPEHQAELARIHHSASQASAHGVVATTDRVRVRHFAHWIHFAQLQKVDPFLRHVDDKTLIEALSGFAQHVREGNAGRGNQVRVGSVQNAICAIGKTFEMDGQPNPTYQNRRGTKHWTKLQDQFRHYKRQDPATLPQLAVPVTLIEHILDQALNSRSRAPIQRQQLATADLINIAFYFLLRVGEYTKPRTLQQNTKPFRVRHVTFRDAQGHTIPNTAPLHELYKAVDASIRIPNQKNGTKGQTLHQQCTQSMHSPIKSLARRVHHIMSTGGNNEAVHIFKHSNPTHVAWQTITADHINNTLKQGADSHGLYKLYNYEKSDISSHSLRAGGAMALHLNGCTDTTIQKLGRWKSKTFLMYIHEQISAFANGLSIKMSKHVPFRAIASSRVEPTNNKD